MGIMLIIKGATYTPPSNGGSNQGGSNQGGDSQGGDNQGSSSSWTTIAPIQYRQFSAGTLVQRTPEELEAMSGDVHRLRVFWHFDSEPASVKVRLSLLPMKYAYCIDELTGVPSQSSVENSSFDSAYTNNSLTGPDWVNVTRSTEDLIYTPNDEAVGLTILFCSSSNNHGAIPAADISELLGFVQQMLQIS